MRKAASWRSCGQQAAWVTILGPLGVNRVEAIDMLNVTLAAVASPRQRRYSQTLGLGHILRLSLQKNVRT